MQFDHVMHWVPDLERATAAYRQLGFAVERGGQHPASGTHNAISGSGSAYLELIAIRDPVAAAAAFGVHWPRMQTLLASGGGAGRFAVHVESVSQITRALRDAGIAASDPVPGSIRREDGSTRTWNIVSLPDSPAWAPFFINYGMSLEQRAAVLRSRQDQPTQWHFDRLVIETTNPESSASWLARAFGCERRPDAVTVPLQGAEILFRLGERDRITQVVLAGPRPPSGEVAGLRISPSTNHHT